MQGKIDMWKGVIPAISTAFTQDLRVDSKLITQHVSWLLESGCTGIVANGTLGEAPTLSLEEKLEVIQACRLAGGENTPIISGVGATSTASAVILAQKLADAGCQGLMILPPYLYSTDWYEMKAHVAAVIAATTLPCMLYNDPSAYGTDFLPEQIVELVQEHSNLTAVKEASTDVRRISAIRALAGKKVALVVGMDDVLLEGIGVGAVGWIAGTANAFPQESVALFNLAQAGESAAAFELYQWILPLMRLNGASKFVQLTKLMQTTVGWGNTFVRPPRLELQKAELQEAALIINQALEQRPQLTHGNS